jgi:hypothetical protein
LALDIGAATIRIERGLTTMKHQTATNEPTLAPPTGTPPQPGSNGTSGAIDTETLALLEAWAIEDATDDPEKLRAAQKELDEFKRAMNENRVIPP